MVNVGSVEKFYRKCEIFDPNDESRRIVLTRSDVKELVKKLRQWLHEEENWREEIQRVIQFQKNTSVTPDGFITFETRSPSKSIQNTVDKYKTHLKLNKNVLLPEGFEEIFRSTAKRNGYDETTYVYGKNAFGVYGYKVFNGKEFPFRKLGRIQNPASTIGSFLRAIPMYEELTMTDLLKLGVVTNGRRLKAVVDILLHEEYLARTQKPLMKRRGVYGYTRTIKNDGLEGESNGQPAVSSNPTELKVSHRNP